MNNETKQTAIEWLIDKHFGGFENVTPFFQKNIEQAKEINKKQMIDFALEFANSDLVYIEYDCEDCPAELTILNQDRLYNETFGGKNE
jgi:hypothetical protein